MNYLEPNPNIEIHRGGLGYSGFIYVGFDMRNRTVGYQDWEKKNYTDVGKPLRKAFAYLADRQLMVLALLQGQGTIALGPISPDNKKWYNDTLPRYEYDLTLAKKYLDDAGWVDADGDGWREFPGIGDSEIGFYSPGVWDNPIRGTIAEMIASQARSIGINVEFVYPPTGDNIGRPCYWSHTCPLFLLGWRIGGSDPGYLYNFYHCSQSSGLNIVGYCSARFDQLMDEYRMTFDNARKVQIIKDAQGILADDLPSLFLYHPSYPPYGWATRKDRFVGWETPYKWRLFFIHPPDAPLSVIFTNPSIQVQSGRGVEVEMKVQDPFRDVVINASVTVRIETAGAPANLKLREGYPGNLSKDGLELSGRTDANGIFKVILASEPNHKEDKVVELSASAVKYGYDAGSKSFTNITIRRASEPWIQITEFKIEPSALSPGESARASVRVLDRDYTSVVNALVRFNTSLGNVTPSATTDINGSAWVTLSIPGNVSNYSIVTVSVDVTSLIDGVEVNAHGNSIVQVFPLYVYSPKAQEQVYLTSAIYMLLAVTVVLIVSFVYHSKLVRRKKK